MYIYPRLAENNCEAELLLQSQSQFKASLLHEPFTHHPKPPSSRDCTYTTDTHFTTQLLPNSFFNFYFATRSSICNLSTSVPKLLRLLACGRGLLYISSNYKNKLWSQRYRPKMSDWTFLVKTNTVTIVPHECWKLKKNWYFNKYIIISNYSNSMWFSD